MEFNNGTSFDVKKLITNSSVVVLDGKVGKPINITGIVSDEFGNPIASVDIVVIVNGKEYNVTTDNFGGWVLTYIPTQDRKMNVLVIYGGNSTYFGLQTLQVLMQKKSNQF